MGIDIYMNWEGSTEEDRKNQYTGFSVTAGDVGYLREAYHGSPYATKALVPEAFETPCDEWGEHDGECGDCDGYEERRCGVSIPAHVLRERLPDVLEVARIREIKLYEGDDDDVKLMQQAFIDFVELAERKETETGKPVRVVASW